MTDFLEQVVAERRADVERAKSVTPESVLEDRAASRGITRVRRYGPRDAFTHALWDRRTRCELAVIAEVKRVSPALGALNVDADVRAIARRYESAGAAAISVLCEPRHWGGSLQDLSAVREVVGVPVLCKDVIVDEYQIVEAWSAGAHAVLLIAEALDDAQLRRFITRASDLGMGVLLEAHESAAFERAVRTSAMVVGVNARDLRAPAEIRPDRIRMLHHLARPEQLLVAESGIGTVEDARLLPARVDAVLVGTALMRSADPTVLIRQLSCITRDRPPGAQTEAPQRRGRAPEGGLCPTEGRKERRH
jgi:indole-3-glycerol phosphate synthase